MQVQLPEAKLAEPHPKKIGNSPGKQTCCFSLSSDPYKTDRVVHDKQALRPTARKWALCNKPAAGVQTLFETSFSLLHVLSQFTGPFYIWRPVANPALPSQHHSLGRCREARQAAPARAVRWCGVGGCGEPTQAASPAPHCWRNPSGAGLGQPEVGRLTFPAQGRENGEGVIAAVGVPKWLAQASKSTAFSTGLVLAYRREGQKNSL